MTIVRYDSHPRNKAALTLFWDLDARNHEVTLLNNKNCHLRDRYGEGELHPFLLVVIAHRDIKIVAKQLGNSNFLL